MLASEDRTWQPTQWPETATGLAKQTESCPKMSKTFPPQISTERLPAFRVNRNAKGLAMCHMQCLLSPLFLEVGPEPSATQVGNRTSKCRAMPPNPLRNVVLKQKITPLRRPSYFSLQAVAQNKLNGFQPWTGQCVHRTAHTYQLAPNPHTKMQIKGTKASTLDPSSVK